MENGSTSITRQVKVTNLLTGESEVKDFWDVNRDIMRNHPNFQKRLQDDPKVKVGNTLYEQM